MDEMTRLDEALARLDAMADADLFGFSDSLNGPKGFAEKMVAERRRQIREWEIALDSMSPHASIDELLDFAATRPEMTAPSFHWLMSHIRSLQKEEAA